MSRSRHSQTTARNQAEEEESAFATSIFLWLEQIESRVASDRIKDPPELPPLFTPTDLRVAYRLRHFFFPDGDAFPSRKKLAGDLLSERTVDRSIRRLEEHGFLRIIWGSQGRKNPHHYQPVFNENRHRDACFLPSENRHSDACLENEENRHERAIKRASETEKTGTKAPEKQVNKGNKGGNISGPPSESRGRADGESGEALLSVGMNSDGAKPDAGKADGIAAEFECFWSVYPKKVNKAKALKAFHKLSASERQEVLAETPRHAAHRRAAVADDPTQATYTLHPTTYLTGQRWREEAQAYSSDTSGPPTIDGKTGEPVPVKNVLPFKPPRNREISLDEVYEAAQRQIKEF